MGKAITARQLRRVGGIVLLLSFFLPFGRACDQVHTPAEQDFQEPMIWFAVAIPFFFPLLLEIIEWLIRTAKNESQKLLVVRGADLLIIASAIYCFVMTVRDKVDSPSEYCLLICMGIIALFAAASLTVKKTTPLWTLISSVYGAYGAFWITYWFFQVEQRLVGGWFALCGSWLAFIVLAWDSKPALRHLRQITK